MQLFIRPRAQAAAGRRLLKENLPRCTLVTIAASSAAGHTRYLLTGSLQFASRHYAGLGGPDWGWDKQGQATVGRSHASMTTLMGAWSVQSWRAQEARLMGSHGSTACRVGNQYEGRLGLAPPEYYFLEWSSCGEEERDGWARAECHSGDRRRAGHTKRHDVRGMHCCSKCVSA